MSKASIVWTVIAGLVFLWIGYAFVWVGLTGHDFPKWLEKPIFPKKDEEGEE